MYTKDRDNVWEDHWCIFDPDHWYICTVTSEVEADALLSHLNKG